MKIFYHIAFKSFLFFTTISCYNALNAASSSTQTPHILSKPSMHIVNLIEKPIARHLKQIKATKNIKDLYAATERAANELPVYDLRLSRRSTAEIPLQYKVLFDLIGQQGVKILGERFGDLLKDLAKDYSNPDKIINQYAAPLDKKAVLEEKIVIDQFSDRLKAALTLWDLYTIAEEASKTFSSHLHLKALSPLGVDKLYARFIPLHTLIYQKGTQLLDDENRFEAMLKELLPYNAITHVVLEKYQQKLDIKIAEYITRIRNAHSIQELLEINEHLEDNLPYGARHMTSDLSDIVKDRGKDLVGSTFFYKIFHNLAPESSLQTTIERLMDALKETESAQEVLELINTASNVFGFEAGFHEIKAPGGPILLQPLKEKMIHKGVKFSGPGFYGMHKRPVCSYNQTPTPTDNLTHAERVSVQSFEKYIKAATTHQEFYEIVQKAALKYDKKLSFEGWAKSDKFVSLQELIKNKGEELLGLEAFNDMISAFVNGYSPEEILCEFDPKTDNHELRQKMTAYIAQLQQTQTIRALLEITEQADSDLRAPILFSDLKENQYPLKFRALGLAIDTQMEKIIGSNWHYYIQRNTR